jgi:hypothetical protein
VDVKILERKRERYRAALRAAERKGNRKQVRHHVEKIAALTKQISRMKDDRD